jgi:hypothetical protein
MNQTNRSTKLKSRVAEILRKNGIFYKEKVGVGGIVADFLIMTPEGRSMIVEAKTWPITDANISRAIQQAGFYKAATGADRAIFVMDGLPHGQPADGIVSEEELDESLSARPQGQQPLSGESNRFSFGEPIAQGAFGRPYPAAEAQQVIFAAMPFSREYDDCGSSKLNAARFFRCNACFCEQKGTHE